MSALAVEVPAARRRGQRRDSAPATPSIDEFIALEGMTMAALLVRDLMTENPRTMGPQDDVATLYDLMDSRHVRHVPIVDEAGDLVGLVSHRDLFRSALGDKTDLPLSAQREMLRAITTEEIMTRTVETVEPDASIEDAAEIMIENKYGCLPVVDGAKLVGILTESDFVRFVAKGLRRKEVRRVVK